ncbi:RING/U-box superfamily protein, partial [Prunus dulcis]
MGGAIMGAIHGAITGQTTETGLVTGAGIGCLAGAIAAIQLMDLGVDGQSLSKVALLGELKEGECARELPTCRHFFHMACIDQWLKQQSSCPMCRTRVHTEHSLLKKVFLVGPVLAISSKG